MVIVETSIFTRQVTALLTDEEYQALQTALVNNPTLGRLMRGSSGVRKVRWAIQGRGKRGGVRVIYYWAVAHERLLMLLMYSKSERDDLSPDQVRVLRQIVEDEYP